VRDENSSPLTREGKKGGLLVHFFAITIDGTSQQTDA
jgi:hypothetical protein